MGTSFSHDGDVTGNHSEPGSYDTDIWAVKLTPEGEIEWQRCYGGWGDERLENPHTILKKSDYNYVIASSTDFVSGWDDIDCDIHANNDRDAWIFEIDLDDTTGIFDTPARQDIIKVYPNPAREYVVLENPIPAKPLEAAKRVGIRFFDFYGREINKPVVYFTENKIVWDCRAIQNGIYFYSIETEGIQYGGKVVIQK